MKISEILRKAANEKLSNGIYDSDTSVAQSCLAIAFTQKRDRFSSALSFVARLGCDFDYSNFDEFPEGEIRQGARFLWLDFAALVAEDEGL